MLRNKIKNGWQIGWWGPTASTHLVISLREWKLKVLLLTTLGLLSLYASMTKCFFVFFCLEFKCETIWRGPHLPCRPLLTWAGGGSVFLPIGQVGSSYKSKLSSDTLSNVIGHGARKQLFWNCPLDSNQFISLKRNLHCGFCHMAKLYGIGHMI